MIYVLCRTVLLKWGVLVEKWDVYNKDGKLTGKTTTRHNIFELGEYHLGVSLWIINQNRELLIQKRAASKRIHPNIWSTTGGSVISGETSMQGCIRETKEEIGLITILDNASFVAINRAKSRQTLAAIKDEKVKNQKVKIAISD